MTRRERLERKLEKREEWAESRDAKSDAAYERVHAIGDGIPMGQPILVGHHSERRARRDVERMQRGMTASVEHAKAAEDHRSKAAGLRGQLATSVFSDDEDAIERLREQVAEMEAERDRVKAYNASCRRGQRDLSLLDERQRENVASLARVAAWQLGKNGALPAYSLSNLGARIRDKQKRIEQITRERAMAEAGERGRGRVMLARYGGECADCGGRIERGDPMVWFRTTKEAVHATCPAKEES